MPLKSVRLSSRDPVWMTPLVKSMLRAKSRISCNNVERHKVINARISEVISANRKNPRLVIGSREWWKNVDLVSQCRNSTMSISTWTCWMALMTFLLCCVLMIVTCRLRCHHRTWYGDSPDNWEASLEHSRKTKENRHWTRWNTLLVLGGSRRAFDTGHYAHLEFVLVYPLLADILE